MQSNAEQIIESIQRLPAPEQEKIRHWLEEKIKPRQSQENWDERVEKFQLALRWIEKNRRKYLGKWVCLDGERLISFGDDAKQVYAEAKNKGIKTPFIEQVREEENAPYWGGWD
jgi:hypothetical protein